MNLRRNENLIREIVRSVKENPLCRERSRQYALAAKSCGAAIDPNDRKILDEVAEVSVRALVALGMYDDCLKELAGYVEQKK
jgi:hypothetical protein